MDVATNLPASISAGVDFAYDRFLDDFPASDGWKLKLYLLGPVPTASGRIGSHHVTADDDADGATRHLKLAAADMAKFEPGLWSWTERMEKTGATVGLRSGKLLVSVDLATAEPGDTQSWLEKALAAVRASILAHDGRLAFSIEGRSVQFESLEQKSKFEATIAARLAALRRAGRRKPPARIWFTGTVNEKR